MILRMGEPGEFALFLSIGFAVLGLFFGPVGNAIGQRISRGKTKVDPATGLSTGEMNAERMAALEDRLLHLEQERDQLEERLDFAERMLTEARSEPRGLSAGESS